MAFRYTPTPTPSNTPTISLTPSITPTITPSSTSCPYVCCLTSGFTTSASGISNMKFLPDNSILIMGGNLSTYRGTAVSDLIRIDSCGNLLNSYSYPNLFSSAGSSGGFAEQSDGKIVVGLGRQTFRLKADYSDVDTTFVSGFTDANKGITGIVCNSDDEILIVGNFGTDWTYSGGVINYNSGIYRFNENGIPDNTWTGKTFSVSVLIEPFDNAAKKDFNNKITIDGGNSIFGNTNYAGIVRLNDDFSLDTTFNAPGFIGQGQNVYTSQPLSNGQYLVGGAFQNYSGFTAQDFLIRLNNNGTLDTTFDFGNNLTNQYVYDVAVQSTGKIVVADSGVRVVRLNSNGSVDNTFISGTTTSSGVYNDTHILLYPNDYILVGGSFNTYNTLPYPKLVKLEDNGELNMCPIPSPTPTSTPTQTMTPTITPTLTINLTPSPTQTPSITPSSTTPPECLCYLFFNETETGGDINYKECGAETPTVEQLGAGQSIRYCIDTSYTPTGDPGITIVPCSSITTCVSSTECISCS